jgi:CubicO group peptidase (beta-lactamase class C family)
MNGSLIRPLRLSISVSEQSANVVFRAESNRRMRLFRALSLLFLPVCAYSQTTNIQKVDFSALRQEIQSRVTAKDVPGISVAVAQGGHIIWEEGFGWADVENKKPATESVPFYTASITKSFTATAIMQLKENGKLQLDKPVNEYLGQAKLHSPKWNAQDATVRRVMSHTGGLTTFTHWCHPSASDCRIDQDIARYGVLVWPPGQVFDYSNLGYGVLGDVISRTSGQRFDIYLRDHIFQPLGMHFCGLNVSSAAERYDQNTHVRSAPKITSHPGASGLYCSAHDLVLFGMSSLAGDRSTRAVIDSQDLAELQRAEPVTGGQYSLGWWLRNQSGYQLVSAQGGTTDAYASLTLVPKKNVAVVVLANSYSQFVSDLSDKILSLVIPEFSSSATTAAPPTTSLPASPPAALIGKWSGQTATYKTPLNVTLDIRADGTAVGQIGLQSSTVRDVSIRPAHFYGQMSGVPDLIDAPGNQYIIELDLALYDGELIGAATAGPLPGRDGNQFPHWAKLTRAK